MTGIKVGLLVLAVLVAASVQNAVAEDDHNTAVEHLSSTNVAERLEALRSLVRGRAETVKALIDIVEQPVVDGELFDHVAQERSAAIVILGQMRAKEAAESLIPCLVPRKGQNLPPQYGRRTFSFAAHSLAEIGEPAVVPLLVQMKDKGDMDLGIACLKVLIKMYGADKAKGMLALESEKATGKAKVNLEQLTAWLDGSRIPWDRARKELSPWTMIMAQTSASKSAGGAAVVAPAVATADLGVLISNMRDRKRPNQERLRVVRQLIAQRVAVPDLPDVIDKMVRDREENAEWRSWCVRLLAEAWTDEEKELEARLLELAMAGDNAVVRNAGVEQLAYLHATGGLSRVPEVLKVMGAAASSPDADTRTKVMAIGTIGRLQGKAMVKTVRSMLTGGEADSVVLAAVATLGRIGDEADLEVLRKLKTSPNRALAAASASAIGEIEKRQASSPRR